MLQRKKTASNHKARVYKIPSGKIDRLVFIGITLNSVQTKRLEENLSYHKKLQ